MSAPVRIPARHGARTPGGSAHSSYAAYSMGRSLSTGGSVSDSLPSASSPLRAVASSPETPVRSKETRRTSLMSSSLAASEHTVVNVGGPDGPPRLITCVRSSQGFDWNQEIFLPSHYDHLISSDLERKRDPVHDIYLTEEEMEGILPQ